MSNKVESNPHVIVIDEQGNKLPFLHALLNKTKRSCYNVNLFGGGNAALYGIYIPMPTNFKLNLSISKHQIDYIEEERVYKEDTLKYSKGKQNVKKLDEQAFALIKDRLTYHIENGDEYNYPNPKDRPLIISAPWADGYKKNYWTLNVLDIVTIYDRVALLGKPGTGKSTALKYLASTLTEKYLTSNVGTSVNALSDKLFNEQYVPIYIEFRKLSDWWKEHNFDASEKISLPIITQYLYNLAGVEYTEESVLPTGQKYVFMFDGIDEIPQNLGNGAFSQSAINRLIGDITSDYSDYKDAKIVFSSRIDEFSGYALSDFEVVELVPMNEYIAVDLIDKIKGICNIRSADSKRLLSELKARGFGDDIVFNPMLLSLLSFVAFDKGQGELPNNKCEVLRASIELLLKRWATKGEHKPSFFSQFEQEGNLYGKGIFNQLEQFAYESEENGQINFTVLFKFMRTEQSNANEIMNYLSRTAGLILEDTDSSVKFAHKSFRSYLAASYIYHQDNVVQLLLKEMDKSIAAGGINETLMLAADILLDDKSQHRALATFVASVLERYSQCDVCLWFLGRLASSQNSAFYDEYIANDTFIAPRLLSGLSRVFHSSTQISTNKRIECGCFLGILGDERSGVGLDSSNLPDIVWCNVGEQNLEFGITQEARKLIAATPWGKDIDFSRELTKSGDTIPMRVEGFEISKYPITVTQFTAFLRDGQGYCNRRLYDWSPASAEYYKQAVEPYLDNDDSYFGFHLPVDFRIPNLPITHVPFFVAVAFCKWLTSKRNDGTVIRIPTEMEWEAVAKMRGGQVFEWGDDQVTADWQDSAVTNNCNCLGSKLNRICPVGAFNDSKDASPIDITGNVWEWTSSYFTDILGAVTENTTINTTDNKALTTDVAHNLLITARGGSLHNGLNGLRVSFRGRDPLLADAADRHSFRVVRVRGQSADYYEEKKIAKRNAKTEVAEGYGLPVQSGDRITIMYSIRRNGEEIQPQSDFTFVLGDGVIHQILEKELMNNHRIACNIRKHILGKDLFDDKGYKDIVKPNDNLEVFMHIKDTMEV